MAELRLREPVEGEGPPLLASAAWSRVLLDGLEVVGHVGFSCFKGEWFAHDFQHWGSQPEGAAMLYQAVITELKDRGLPAVFLTAPADNEKLLRAYVRSGWVIESIIFSRDFSKEPHAE